MKRDVAIQDGPVCPKALRQQSGRNKDRPLSLTLKAKNVLICQQCNTPFRLCPSGKHWACPNFHGKLWPSVVLLEALADSWPTLDDQLTQSQWDSPRKTLQNIFKWLVHGENNET